MKLIAKFNQDKIINFLIFEITITAVKYYIVQSIPGLYIYNSIANMVISILLIPFLLYAIDTAYNEKREFTILVFFFTAIVIFTQFLLYPKNIPTIASNLPKIIGMSLGCLIAANALSEYELFYHKLVKVSKIIICFAVVQYIAHEFYGVIGSEQLLDYDMSFGFFLVIPSVTQFAEICSNKKNKILNIMLFVLATVMVITMGSRGAVLAIMIGCALCFYEKSKLKCATDLTIVVFCCVILILLYFSYREISKLMYDFLLDHGIKSRLLSMMAYGDITYSAGRDVLQSKVRILIAQHPWIGSGMFSNTSSHNIFYEVVLFYGYPIGAIIILIIIFEWMKILFVEDYFKRQLMAIFLSYAIVDSLLNLTVLGKDMFWISLGFSMSSKIFVKRKKIK